MGNVKNGAMLPDPFTFADGRTVTNREELEARLDEMKLLYETEMYGTLPDPATETVTYAMDGDVMKVTVSCEGRSTTFDAKVTLPKNKVYEETPVLFVYFGLFPEQAAVAAERGYAVIGINVMEIAADSFPRAGKFYDVHPIRPEDTNQTGALLAWGWAFSKAIDALENGAAKELGLSCENILLTGVSRCGKSTAVAGAYDRRIRVVAPSCSGAGGMALYRYTSEGTSYDLTGVNRGESYVYKQNEPLSCLQSDSEGHWFNDKFRTYASPEELPLEQYMLSALCARGGRYLVISGSYCDEDWVNAPAMWMNYLGSKPIFEAMGMADHLAVCLHETGHMVTVQDLKYLFDFCDYHLYGKQPTEQLGDLTTSLFALSQNRDEEFEKKLAFLPKFC